MLALAFGEAGARALAWTREQKIVADWQRIERGQGDQAEILLPDTETTLGRLVRTSDVPDIIYEFIPNLRARYLGQPCLINAHGFRDGEWPAPERTPGSTRIVLLGDSVLFGWGVAQEQAFGRVMADRLRSALPGRTIEVLNTGVPGYNTAMEVATLEHKVLPWRPDIVLLDWVGNDTDLPNMIARQTGVLSFDRSYLYELVRKVLGWRTRWIDTPLQMAPFQGERFESRPEHVPEIYRHMVGEEGVARAFERLAELSREHGFRVAVTCHFDLPDFVRDLCKQHGWPTIENGDNLRVWMQQHDVTLPQYRECELVIGNGDPHPSPMAHRMFGELLADTLRTMAWL